MVLVLDFEPPINIPAPITNSDELVSSFNCISVCFVDCVLFVMI